MLFSPRWDLMWQNVLVWTALVWSQAKEAVSEILTDGKLSGCARCNREHGGWTGRGGETPLGSEIKTVLFLSRRFGSKTDARNGGGRKGLHQRNQRTLRNGTNRPKRPRRKPRRVKARWTRTADNKSDRTRPRVCTYSGECCGLDYMLVVWWNVLPCCTFVHIYILLLILCPLFIFNLSFLCNVTHARRHDARWMDWIYRNVIRDIFMNIKCCNSGIFSVVTWLVARSRRGNTRRV